MTKKLKQTVLAIMALMGLASFLLPATLVSAATPAASTFTTQADCETAHYTWDPVVQACTDGSNIPAHVSANCGTNETPLVTKVNSDGSKEYNDRVCCPKGSEDSATSCMLGKYVNPVVTGLSVLAGIAVVIGIVMGGIQYGASAGDPQKAAKAKGMITKALMGLVAFMFLYSAFQFLSPGNISKNFEPNGSGGSIASQCSNTFLGLKPWFAYLPDSSFESGTCNITNFSLLGSDGKDSQLVPVLLAITDDLVRIAGMVAVAFVITGGIKYVTSGGEPDKTKQALETIISALVGVAIAIIAAAVVSYIGTQLSK